MKNLLYPDLYVDSIFRINLQRLKNKGYRSIIVDIDNTLVAWDQKYATKRVIEWFGKVEKLGFDICLVSNATETRVVKFNEEIKVLAIHRATKPRKKPFLEAIKKMNTVAEKTVMIGDQIFTDVLGGNRVGLYTILVVPISGNELLWTKFVRRIERFIIRKIKKGA